MIIVLAPGMSSHTLSDFTISPAALVTALRLCGSELTVKVRSRRLAVAVVHHSIAITCCPAVTFGC
ncbi:MAG TPA: hypothetical protein VI072_21545 [Polyangiaceae bacterium]